MELGKGPLRILTRVFKEHAELAEFCKGCVGTVDDTRLPQLTKTYLKMLGSPNGNDILEEVCVRANGREPKAEDTKHGADSADGALEAKPMKTTYNAHISDDTPASLLRHQTIPYIFLAEWSKDGVNLLWALVTSYRVFDTARYRGIVATFPTEYQGLGPLPDELEGRRKRLLELVDLRERLVKERNIPRYVRSNPLPIEALADLKPGQYTIWADPSLASSRGKAHRILWSLWTAQPQSYVLDETFIARTEAIRNYFRTT